MPAAVTTAAGSTRSSAVDEFTVEFELCGPHPAFLAQIAFGVFGIQPEEHLEATGGAPLDNPIGTGPYTLKEWVRGDSVVYKRFDDYYGEKPTHSTAVLKWATESAGRLLELQSGTVDGITFPGTEDLADHRGRSEPGAARQARAEHLLHGLHQHVRAVGQRRRP